MAYADLGALRSRAGVLADAWTDTTRPGTSDLQRFLVQASAVLDAQLASSGYAVPVTNEVALGALEPLVADLALVWAIEATWPGAAGPGGVRAAYEGARDRIYGDGDELRLDVVVDVLDDTIPGGGSGAGDLWSKNGLEGNESLDDEALTIGRSMRL